MSYSEKNINPGFPGKGGRGCLGACISVFMSFGLWLNASSAERGLISGQTFPPSATQFRVPGAMEIQHELGDGLFCLYSPTLSSAMALERVIGEFNILVILVRLPSDSPNVQIVYAPSSPLNPDPEPVTVPKAESIFFDNRYPDQWNTPQFVIAPASSYQNYSTITLNDFFREASYDKMRITGQVGGVYVLNLPAESNFFEIYEPAIDSAASAGFNVQWGGMADPTNLTGDFDKVVIVSTMRPVPLGGVAMGRKVVWLNGRITLGVCAHELGHTFGAGHASGWYCLDQSWPLLADTTCGPIDGFADIFDPMGSGIGHYNARLKELFGWLDSSQFLNVTASGQYTLTPLETSDGLKALLFGRDNSYYYFQFRRYIGFDENYAHWNKPYGVDWTNVDGLFA
ncbi:MAG: hypothetical protein IIB00_06960, partial [candidate division Zixibacteria bacterium]|nr:hypothetical protein [candidate division Zixibacteria bacterium]